MPDFNLRSQDVLNSNQGTLWLITQDGKQRKMADVRNITANIEVATEEFRCLGEMMHRHKGVGMRGSGSMTLYTGTPDFIDYLTRFKSSGINYRFLLYCEMADPESPVGSGSFESGATGRGARATLLRDVLIHGAQLFKLDTEDGLLDYDVDFDFDEYEVLQNFEPAVPSGLVDTGGNALDFSNLINP